MRTPFHNLKAWRKFRLLSVRELAALVDKQGGKTVSASMIAQLEQGRAGYTQDTLEALANALDIEPWKLLFCPPEELPRRLGRLFVDLIAERLLNG